MKLAKNTILSGWSTVRGVVVLHTEKIGLQGLPALSRDREEDSVLGELLSSVEILKNVYGNLALWNLNL